MNKRIVDLRREYTLQQLSESDVDPNPVQQFARWFEQALSAQVPEPNAMTLATVTREGKPSARMVLLKACSDRGFEFYTSYVSPKGEALAHHPYAALVFWWAELERQVRIEGPATRLSDQEADAYFKVRPRGSQLAVWASRQSQVIGSRAELEGRLQEASAAYEQGDVPRPPHWGGYRVDPQVVEFWQGRPNRLHDRLRYHQDGSGAWVIQRLMP